MRIAHVIDTLNAAHGGPPIVAQSLAKAQAALGHDVRLLIEHGDPSSVVKTTFLPRRVASQFLRSEHTEAKALVANVDILHFHGVWESMFPVVARAARRQNKPYIVTPHGMLDPWSLRQKKWKKKLALAFGYRKMLNRAAAIHALNVDEKALIAPLGLRPPCEVIPNGISLEELDPPPDPKLFRSRTQGPGDRPYILFLGRLHHKKGLDILAEAFAAIASKLLQFDLVVAGPDGGEEQLFRKQIDQLGLSSRTWLTGPLHGPDKWSALVGASVFCLPSRQEGFSLAILEAMACRVPVVVSESCHFPEVRNVGAGKVVPLEAQAVARAMDAILSDLAGAKIMGDAGRQCVEERFTWPKVAVKTLAMYQRLL